MVIMLPKRQSFGEKIGESLGAGITKGFEQAAENKKLAAKENKDKKLIDQENEAAAKMGLDLSGISDPKMRQEAFKQMAKYNAQESMFKKLGLEQDFGGQGSQESPRMETGRSDQNVNEAGEIEVGIVPLKTARLIDENKIATMARINPAVADKMQKHNDNIMQQQRHDENLAFKQKNAMTKDVRDSYKVNQPFIDKTYDQYETSLNKDAIIDRMDQIEESGELSESGVINLLESIGMKPEWLKNPANEEYTKLGLDLLGGGSLQADYGARILASEFKVSQQRIPTLSQTPKGRKQIKENIKAMLLPAKLKQERMQYYLDKAERTGDALPQNLRGRILKDIKPQLEEAYDKFKQRNGRYKVKEGTFPDDNAVEKYFFIADGNEDKAIKLMSEDGYDVKP